MNSEFELKSNLSGILRMDIDNSWVVPYSPDLLRKFRTHMNIELCIFRFGSIKYFFKYVCKGSNRVTVEIGRTPTDVQNESNSKLIPGIDEIRHYQDARYVSASETAWRLFSFPMVELEPSVERLEIHLEGHHSVYYKECEHENANGLRKEQSTKLTAYFSANQKYKKTKRILCAAFPKYFTWDKAKGIRKPRTKYEVRSKSSENYEFSTCRANVVGRMYDISPREGGFFFEHCFYTNLVRLPSRICAWMKVSNIQLTVILAVPWVCFQMVQNGVGAWGCFLL